MSADCRVLPRIMLPLFLWAISACAASAQPIIDAVKRNDLAAVQRLLIQNPRAAAATDEGGSTPLHWASRQGNLQIMQQLVAYRADINAKQREGDTPLHSAAVVNQASAMQLLLERGADPNIRTRDGNAPIHAAARFGATFAVSALLSDGVDVNTPNADGNTALAVAAWYGPMETGQFLIAAGADLSFRNKFGKTALDEANRAGKGDFARMLVDYQRLLDERATRALIHKSSGLDLRTGFAAWADPKAVTRAVYSEDFHAEKPGPEWKLAAGDRNGSPSISATPIGARRFLGEFGSQAILLTLADLPEHKEISITFDLFMIRSQDGNVAYLGPDVWSLGVADGPTLLQTTFVNFRTGVNSKLKIQAYPGEFPGDHNSPCAGAEETNSLGYKFKEDSVPVMDSVYKIRYTFASTSRAIVFRFAGSNMSETDNESWGITNVKVAVATAPAAPMLPAAVAVTRPHPKPAARPQPLHTSVVRRAAKPTARTAAHRPRHASKPETAVPVKRIHSKKIAPKP